MGVYIATLSSLQREIILLKIINSIIVKNDKSSSTPFFLNPFVE